MQFVYDFPDKIASEIGGNENFESGRLTHLFLDFL